MTYFISELFDSFNSFNILFVWVLFYVLSFLAIYLWRDDSTFFLNKIVYTAEQKVHVGSISRLGGLIIYTCLCFFTLIEPNAFLIQTPLFCILPMMLISVKEDLFFNVSYQKRFFAIAFSSICLIYFYLSDFPIINHLPIISNLFEYKSFNIAFFTLCILILANGCNFIDGMNGLLSFYIFGVILNCIFLSFVVSDIENGNVLLIYALLILSFITLNFPFGKIFLGDSGAYLFAMLLGVWVINFFSMNSNISSWNALLIFFYPTTEVLYSFIRKVYQKKSPFKPDRGHLHLKVYDLIKTNNEKPNLSNNLTTIYLSFFWIAPPLVLPLVYDSQVLIFFTLTFFSVTYLLINIKLTSIPKKKY